MAENIHFTDEKTEAQKGAVMRSDHTMSWWQSLDGQLRLTTSSPAMFPLCHPQGKKVLKKLPSPVPDSILEFNKADHAQDGFPHCLSSACPFSGGLFTEISVLFLPLVPNYKHIRAHAGTQDRARGENFL